MQRGDLAPHFEVTTIDGARATYAAIWQRRNLVLVVLPREEQEADRRYASTLKEHAQEFDALATVVVVTREIVANVTAPGVVVADRWGEVYFAAAGPHELPPVDELLEWLGYIQKECPECEGERR